MNNALGQWLGSQETVTDSVAWVELRHITVRENADPVQRWRWNQVNKHRRFASEVMTTAQQWADGIGAGPQRFALALLDEGEHILGQYVMRVASDVTGGLAYDSEPATMAGVTKQLMRHTEALMKGTAAAQAQIVAHLLEENERMRGRCNQLEGKHLELVSLAEDLLSQRSAREIEHQRHLSHERRRDEMLNKLGTLVPVALTKMSGKALPANLDPAMRALAQSMGTDDLKRLATVLKPEQVFALATVLEKVASDGGQDDESSTSNGSGSGAMHDA